MPELETFIDGNAWMLAVGVFVLFRAFDILKPWPIGRSQRLPGGWGVTMDDVLAALAVNLVLIPFLG